MVTFEQLSGFTHRRAFAHQPLAECDLIGGELGWATEAHSPRFSCYSPAAGARVNQFALKFGDARDHRQYHATSWRSRILSGLAERAQASACFLQLLGDLEQVAGGARQSVKPRHDDGVIVA